MKHTLKVNANGDREVVITRSFDAPRTLVWDAYTKPALLKRWLGVGYVPDVTLDVCEVDLRVGGKYRYVWRGPNFQMGMSGEYREVKAPERIVSTEKYDDAWYPGSAVGTMVLTEKAGVTTVTTTMRYDTKEARDAVMKSPMEHGMAFGYDTLEKLLANAGVLTT